MARCPECNKFVSYAGDEEPEEENVTVDEDGSYTIAIRIHKDCAVCGTEVAEATCEIDGTLEETCAGLRDAHWRQVRGLGPDDVVPDEAPEGHALQGCLDDLRGTEREGINTKKKKPQRFYGFEALLAVTCECGVDLDGEPVSGEVEAGELDPIG